MSEQPHYKTTPAQGWDQMRSILDREMPVQRRRNRFVLFWRIFNVAMILGVVGIGLYKGIHVLAQKPVPVEETLMSDDRIKTPAGEATSHEKAEVVPAEAGSPSPASATGTEIKPTLSPRPAVTLPKKAMELPPSKLQKTSKPKHTEPMAFNTKHDPTLMTEIEPASNPNDVLTASINAVGGVPDETLHTPATETEPVDHLHPLRNGQVVDPVPTVPVDLIASAFSPTVGPIAPVLTTVDRNRISVRPFLAIEGLAGYNGGTGGQAAAGLDLGLSKRLTLTAGLSYRDFSPHSSLFAPSRDVSAFPEQNAILNQEANYGGYPAYIVGDLLGSNTAYQAINPLIDQVRQWQIQAGIRYHLTRRLFTEGGMMFALKTDVTSQYPIIEGDPLLASPFSRVSNSLTEYNVVRSSMTSWYAGLGLLFGRHLSLHVNWTHGLNSYLLADTQDQMTDVQSVSRSDYIRGLSLGIRYTL